MGIKMRNPRLRKGGSVKNHRIRPDSARPKSTVFVSVFKALAAAVILYALTVYLYTKIVINPIVEGNISGPFLQVSHLFVFTFNILLISIVHCVQDGGALPRSAMTDKIRLHENSCSTNGGKGHSAFNNISCRFFLEASALPLISDFRMNSNSGYTSHTFCAMAGNQIYLC